MTQVEVKSIKETKSFGKIDQKSHNLGAEEVNKHCIKLKPSEINQFQSSNSQDNLDD